MIVVEFKGGIKLRISAINFCGVKGATYRVGPDSDPEVFTNYYPYAKETKQETDEFVMKNSRPHISYSNGAGLEFLPPVRVKVLEKLPFTKEEHRLYENEPWNLPMEKRIEIGNTLHEIQHEQKVKTRASIV